MEGLTAKIHTLEVYKAHQRAEVKFGSIRDADTSLEARDPRPVRAKPKRLSPGEADQFVKAVRKWRSKG